MKQVLRMGPGVEAHPPFGMVDKEEGVGAVDDPPPFSSSES